VLQELETLGVEAVKIQFNYRDAGGPIPIRKLHVKAEDAFEWFKWKQDMAAWRDQINFVIVVILGALTLFVAGLAALFGYWSIPPSK
jgi:hypothetical protein